MPRTCTIARALEVVGERWALLVVREVSLGVRRFADIQAATGAPPAVLADRLRSLVAADVLRTRPYREPGARSRQEYVLTSRGRELQPVLAALRDWGDRHLAGEDGPPVVVRHRACRSPVHAVLLCESGHRVDDLRDLQAEPVRIGVDPAAVHVGGGSTPADDGPAVPR